MFRAEYYRFQTTIVYPFRIQREALELIDIIGNKHLKIKTENFPAKYAKTAKITAKKNYF
jgi:hypothetical protein